MTKVKATSGIHPEPRPFLVRRDKGRRNINITMPENKICPAKVGMPRASAK